MALTIDYDNYTFRDRMNDCLVRRFQMTGPASYPTGGVAIANLGDFGWGETHTLLGTLWNGTVLRFTWLDRANQKVIILDDAGAQIANGVDLSAFTGEMLATGR